MNTLSRKKLSGEKLSREIDRDGKDGSTVVKSAGEIIALYNVKLFLTHISV